MATAPVSIYVSVAEYLASTYRPDCDYIDGEVRERNLGETPHSGLQAFFASLFIFNEAAWGLIAFTEQRVQVAPTRFRIPDVCAIRPGGRTGGILRKPPAVCIEVLSPGDTMSGMQKRIADYVAFGVENIWLIDPVERLAWTADAAGIHPLPQDGAFSIEGTPVHIPLPQLYARLDLLEEDV